MKTEKKTQQLLLTFLLSIISCAIVAIHFKWQQTGKLFVPETILVFVVILVSGSIMALLALRMAMYFSNKSSHQLMKQVIPAIILFYVAWYIVSNTVIVSVIFFGS